MYDGSYSEWVLFPDMPIDNDSEDDDLADIMPTPPEREAPIPKHDEEYDKEYIKQAAKLSEYLSSPVSLSP